MASARQYDHSIPESTFPSEDLLSTYSKFHSKSNASKSLPPRQRRQYDSSRSGTFKRRYPRRHSAATGYETDTFVQAIDSPLSQEKLPKNLQDFLPLPRSSNFRDENESSRFAPNTAGDKDEVGIYSQKIQSYWNERRWHWGVRFNTKKGKESLKRILKRDPVPRCDYIAIEEGEEFENGIETACTDRDRNAVSGSEIFSNRFDTQINLGRQHQGQEMNLSAEGVSNNQLVDEVVHPALSEHFVKYLKTSGFSGDMMWNGDVPYVDSLRRHQEKRMRWMGKRT